jgi:pyruvate/2-oxoglutarate dehydrogenase complex dihydrolipoamide acyltransferase (E2) component
MKDLAARAKDGKLQPAEYQGGTASISNMGMFGIKQFDAVINPPQAMIMAIGAGEKRPYVINDSLQIATVMSATGSFDHRAIDGGLITPIVANANAKAISAISTEMGDLAGRAKEGKLQPAEYQGGTASISNMGMFGIKQFDAVINPPQGMIMAIGAGEKRPYVVGDALTVATVMSATGSFDHRAIDGADGARLMKAFKALVENPLGLVA